MREVEALVNDLQQRAAPDVAGAVLSLAGRTGMGAGPGASRSPAAKDPDTAAFEKDLTDALGLKVEIRRGPGETGFLTIQYGNYEQLDHIRDRLVAR
ncbi:MAG TPA: hypothetical protein VNB28_10790 [Methylomirabilota bacterium]|nr:hypothetical protein [Methylomirabilota bacterium]